MEENDYCARVEAENTALRNELERQSKKCGEVERLYAAEKGVGDSLRKMVVDRDATINILRDRLRRVEEDNAPF